MRRTHTRTEGKRAGQWRALILLSPFALGCAAPRTPPAAVSAPPLTSEQADSPRRDPELEATGSDRLEGYFPNFVLTTQAGKKVRFYDDLLKGRVVLINFFMTQCKGSCPGTTANLVAVQKALGAELGGVGDKIVMISISLEPDVDTPAELADYAARFGAGPGWYFLTGEYDEIEVIRRKLGATDPDPVIDADKTQHAGILIYGNERLGRWASIPSLVKPERIVSAVRQVM